MTVSRTPRDRVPCFEHWEMFQDERGQWWVQPPDSLPPIPYFISDGKPIKGLERK